MFFTPAMAQQGRPALIRTVEIEQGMAAPTADMTGTLYFDRISRVSPEEASRVTVVRFKEGDRVKKGAILVRMDTRLLEKELALQEARLLQLEIRTKKAKLNLDRQTRLFKNNVTPESVYDEQRFTHEELLQEQIVISRQIDKLKIRLSKHVVTAPFDGVVLEKQVDLGEWVGPGTQICKLGAADAVFVQVPVAEHLVRYIKIGESLPVYLHAYGMQLTGIMQGIRPVADARTKNIALKLKLDYQGPVAQNMSATVKVPVSDKKDVLIMPRDALVQVRGQDLVYIVEAGKASPRPVTVVHAHGLNIGVTANGLSKGMTVVTEGNERLQPGQAVTVQAGN